LEKEGGGLLSLLACGKQALGGGREALLLAPFIWEVGRKKGLGSNCIKDRDREGLLMQGERMGGGFEEENDLVIEPSEE